MPRPAKPARLWLRPAQGDRAAVWCILDGGKRISTGCGEDAHREAEEFLARYIAGKHQPASADRGPRRPAEVQIADVLSVYLDEVVAAMPDEADRNKTIKRVDRLLDWWGADDKTLADVSPASCLAYTEHRIQAEVTRRVAGRKQAAGRPDPKVTGGGARRDLEDLRSAINHHAAQELHAGKITVTLGKKAPARQVWLTRDEVARLLRVCWRHGRTIRIPKGQNKGDLVESRRHDLRHIVRFLLLAVYTGSRPGACFTASIVAGANRSHIDVDQGLFYRLAEGRAETNKRQPPVRLPPRLLAHIRRWKATGAINDYVVAWDGLPVKSIKTAFAGALKLAGIDKKVSPHTLRHTAVTWLMQAGVPIWETAGYVGMSEQMVRDVYGHQHPDHQAKAVAAIAQSPRRR